MKRCNTPVIVGFAFLLFVPITSFAIGYQGGQESSQITTPRQPKETFISSPMTQTYIEQFPVDYARVSAEDVKKYYPYSERYLDFDVPEYFILREDYVFSRSNGEKVRIPAGFIWDGASIPEWLNKRGIIDKSNNRYQSAIREGLVHDYMYRNPHVYTQEEADDLFCKNLEKYGNENPWKVCQGVKKLGFWAYDGHKAKQKKGYYDVFTPEFYQKNIKIFQSGPSLNRPELFKRDSQCKREDLPEEKVCIKMPDLTKLINLLKQVIEEYRKILAAGRKMSDDERVAHENLMNEIYNEMYALADEVKKNFTKEEQEQFIQLFKERVQPLSDQGVALQRQIEAKGYGHFVNRFRQMPFGSKEDAAAKKKIKP